MNMKRMRLSLLLFGAMTIGLVSCQDKERSENEAEIIEAEAEREARLAEDTRLEEERLDWETNSVFTRSSEDEELTTFSKNLETTELSATFTEEEGPFTIFAPTNVAYESLSAEQKTQMESKENLDQNRAMLNYLVVDGEMTLEQLKEEIQNADGNYTLTTQQGEELTASLKGEDVVLTDASGNTATITRADVDASNGVVHVIDGVLMPKDPSVNAAATNNADEPVDDQEANELNNVNKSGE